MTYYPTTAEEAAEILRSRSDAIHISSKHESSFAGDVLSLAEFNSVIAYEPEEMIIETRSAITLAELERILGERNQWIPTLVPSEHPDTTLAAAIANDRYSPRARSLGMLRTTILGGKFITGDGVIFKSGSRVVKSVAGYDTHRAFCGSRGLFGAIISVTLKVQPRPEKIVRCITGDDVSTYHPTIREKYRGGYFVELAGYTEDIESDVNDMISKNMSVSFCDKNGSSSVIREIIAAHEPSPVDAEAMKVLQRLREAFDPKGILR